MAKKTTAKKGAAKEQPAAKAKSTKKQMTPEERKAKAEARKQRLAELPEGQRPNSKQIDVIEGANGTKVAVYAQVVRKFGVIITAVVFDKAGNIIAVGGTEALAGYKVKTKKGHGNLVVGVPGVGKKGSSAEVEDEDDEDGDED